MVDRWPVLVVPGLYVADDDLLDLLGRYAEAGGHLVLTPRTGYADEEAVVRHVVMPGVLREAAGAHYLEFTNLVSDVPVRANAVRWRPRSSRRSHGLGRWSDRGGPRPSSPATTTLISGSSPR